MLIAFGIGIIIGIIIVIIALNMMMNTEPTGCIVFFGLLISMLLYLIIIIVKFVGGS
jgi:hypothetical protein